MRSDRLYVVSLDPDLWLTNDQASALERSLVNYVSGPHPEEAFTTLLGWEEKTCLDTAAVGVVLSVQDEGFVNRIHWPKEFAPRMKTDAGWPSGL
jgi:hypothetical protein